MSYINSKVGTNILAIFTGIVAALMILIPFGILAALIGFSFGEIQESRAILSDCLLLLAVSLGSFLGGNFTAKNSSGKSIIPVIITSLGIIGLGLLLNNFNFQYISTIEIISLIGITPLTLLGGYLFLRNKVIYK